LSRHGRDLYSTFFVHPPSGRQSGPSQTVRHWLSWLVRGPDCLWCLNRDYCGQSRILRRIVRS
ncbi:hypothetical protein BAE44_0013337, partial [Dichanthelium oligosanthes]